MARRNPEGRGRHENYVARAESRAIRQTLQDDEAGWLLSHLGEQAYTHYDTTGVTVAQSTLNLYAIPDRPQGVLVSAARIAVAALAAASSVYTALYLYDGTFRRVPGSTAIFDSTSTGLKTFSFVNDFLVTPKARLFMAVMATGGAPVLEGYQAGTVITGRPVAVLSLASTTTLPGMIERAQLTKSYTTDCPAVVYLSRDAQLVL